MAVNPENLYTGNGYTDSYNFTFEYLEETDIKVSLDGVITTAYSLTNATTILFDTAPSNGVEIRIYRDTNVDTVNSTFFAGSAIRAQDLNDNFTQTNNAIQEVKAFTWDSEADTIHSDETWVSSDSQIATTAAMDQRFQDEAAETITSAETWPDNDDTIATTAAIDNRIDTAITNDIGTDGTGITVTDDGDGTITLGLAANSVDFDRIKDADIITYAEQDAGSPTPADTNIFTSSAAARRFDTIVNQTEQSSSVNWEVGKTWLQNDSEKTVRIWDGAAWVAVASGGAFTTLPKVVYVDSVNGNDSLEGHRISNPKRTIKAAIEQINNETDANGDGSVVIVAPGVYQEAAPIDIQKKNVSIIGQALRSCIVHPTVATEENTLFRLNTGSYVANLTITGVKASGTRGGNSLDTDSTYGLPTNQGWNFAFYPGATIVKSPYIYNCTNFSDSEIDNSDLNAFNPRGGLGGDTDSQPTGGGILIDGNAVSSSSPLRSMVCDSYTHVGLDGPAIFVTNNGYCQATSSYAFFTHYHIKTLNGGQANLAASTTDFGRYGLIAQGRSSSAIFTATTTATASDGATTFTIGAPSASGSWFGSATRPQSNMVVDIGGNTYSIIGATANGAGWDVEISRPDPNNLSTNLGLNGAVSSGSGVSFYLRSMIASSGHTMEYVGSGTNYSALPENGGVPIEANEIVEIGSGKVWAATTNHQGKFTVGPTFNVDQVTGYVNIANGAIGIEKLIENLDLNSFTLSDSIGDVNIDDQMDMNTHKIVNVVDPTSAQDAATKNYVDTSSANTNYVAVSGDSMTGNLNMGSNTVTGLGTPSSASDAATKSYVDAVDTAKLDKAGDTMTGNLTMNAQSDVRFADADSSNYVAIQAPATIGTNYTLTLPNSTGNAGEALITDASGNLSWSSNVTTTVDQLIEGDTKVEAVDTGANGEIQFTTDGTRAMTIDSSQRLGVGTSSPSRILHVATSASSVVGQLECTNQTFASLDITNTGGYARVTSLSNNLLFSPGGTERVRIDSSGRLGVGTSSPGAAVQIDAGNAFSTLRLNNTAGGTAVDLGATSTGDFAIRTGTTEAARIDSSGRLGLGTSSPASTLDVSGNARIGAGSGGNFENAGTRLLVANTGGDAYIQAQSADSTGTSGIKFGRNSVANRAGIDWSASTDKLTLRTGGTSAAITVDSSQRVGIGTTSPARLLHLQSSSGGGMFTVERTSATTSALVIAADSGEIKLFARDTNSGSTAIPIAFMRGGSDESMRIDSSGNLGIGVSNPGAKLHVSGTTITDDGTNARLTLAGTSSAGQLFSTTTGFGAYEDLEIRAAQYLFKSNATTERLRIDSSGRLGVGTSTPQAELHLHDATGLSRLRFTGGAAGADNFEIGQAIVGVSNSGFSIYDVDEAATRFVIDSSGRLGVGTSSPLDKLHVVGAARFGDGTNFAGVSASSSGAAFEAAAGSANVLFKTGGAERVRIDSSGRLLVGKSSAETNYYYTTAARTPNVQISCTSTTGLALTATNGGANAVLASSYNVTTSGRTLANLLFMGYDGAKHLTAARITAETDGTTGTNDMPGRLVFSTTADGASSPTERMRIDNAGETELYTNTSFNLRTNRTSGLTAALNVYQGATSTSTGTLVCQIRADGDLLNTNGAYDALSDAKLKENIVDANSQWDDIKAVRIRNWNFKEETGYGTHTQIGTIAQELELVSPGLVRDTPDTDEDGNDLGTTTKSVKNSILFMKAVKALQEAMERIEQLEAKVAALEAN